MPIRVRIAFVRHGYSCMNGIYSFLNDTETPIPQMVREKAIGMIDPPLTSFAVRASRDFGPELAEALGQQGFNRIDILGSSVLIRAIETAHHMSKTGFPGRTPLEVSVLPLIAERNAAPAGPMTLEGTTDSMPLSVTDQEQELTKRGIRADMARVRDGKRYLGCNMIRFVDLELRVIIKEHLSKKGPPPDNCLNIFIVSHKEAIKELVELRGVPALEKRDSCCYNNGCFYTETLYDEGTRRWLKPPNEFHHLDYALPANAVVQQYPHRQGERMSYRYFLYPKKWADFMGCESWYSVGIDREGRTKIRYTDDEDDALYN